MNSIEEFNCIFCKECFDNKEDLQEHFRKHGDPKFNESVKSKNRFPSDSQGSEKPNEDGEVVRCDVCTEVFPTISKAITHKHKVHPDHDAKYFCPWCGKLFTMKHLYNKHVQTNHESNEGSEDKCFRCDYCEVDFLVASAMVYHNKFFHRQDTELAAIGQSRKLKMFGQEPLQIYYCPFCGEEYCNKVNLHKHMSDDHSDENQSPDDVLRCPLCDAIFYHLDAYEVHLTFHSPGDLYSEENEILSEVVEYSLETVPPVMEKVENCESQEEAEATMNSIGIESFLQQAMNETENDNSNSEVLHGKKKKHKKHKKSKKSAITLDEFLNMNKDVFGEGIDFQGIEEVPTQLVAKQLKKPPLKAKTVPKRMQSSELEKLKKQGIVVRMKSGKNQGVRIGKGKPINKTVNAVRHSAPNQRQHISPAKSNAISTSSDVLSKLLNQSNSQLKIVKKSAQESLKSEEQDSIDPTSTENKTSDNVKSSKLNENEIKMDKTNNDIASNGESDAANNIIKKQDRTAFKSSEFAKDTSQDTPSKLDTKCLTENDDKNTKLITQRDEPLYGKPNEPNDSNNLNENSALKKSDTNPTNTLNALRNISQHITVKSVSAPTNNLKPQNIDLKTEIDDFANTEDNSNSVTKEKNESIENQEIKGNDHSLTALKHLNHLLIKPANQYKPTSPIGAKKTNLESLVNAEVEHSGENYEEDEKGQPVFKLTEKDAILNVKHKPQDQKDTSKSLDALKNLSKHITIKSVNQSHAPKSINKSSDNNSFNDEGQNDDLDNDDEVIKHETKSKADTKDIETFKTRSIPSKFSEFKSTDKVNSGNQSPKIINRPIPGKIRKPDEELNLGEENITKKQYCANILKQLPNVTAKPVNVVKHMQQVTLSTLKSSNQTINMKTSNFVQTCLRKEETKEESEIYNIDDSDDEILNSQNCSTKPTSYNSSTFTTENTKPNIDSIDALKNLSKHITVKSKNQQTSPINKELTNQNEMTNDINDYFSTDELDDDVENLQSMGALKNLSKHITVKSTNQQKMLNKDIMKHTLDDGRHDVTHDELDIDFDNENMAAKSNSRHNITLQHKLKNLSKNITVKSKNSSPNTPVKPEISHFKQNKLLEGYDTDSDSNSKGVQISEITDNSSDNDFTSDQTKNENIIVKYPDELNSDNDDHFMSSSDIESEIKTNTLQKPNPSKLNTQKKISRDITIIPPKEKEDDLEEENEMESHWDANVRIPNINKELSIKPFKQTKSSQHDEKNVYNANKIVRPITNRPVNQSALNQRVSTSSGQVNTVNKEVTVKTFQTKTVIQEITTTVTKTIRTVNQSVNQEVRNISQSSTPMIRPQKVQGMRPHHQMRNCQGIPLRQATPSVGPRIRNAGPMAAVGNTFKQSNQLIPVRPGINLPRTNSPRMPVMKKATPSTCNPQRPVLGKSLKIAPNAVMPSAKRSCPEDLSGPFSCFKKPKESLIPVPDVPNFSNSQEGETVQFASSSQMSRSNFSSSSKTVKGNSVVTSTQTKSEISTSSKQLSRLGNMSGLKVVKTSQAKQASQVEDKCEISTSKRTTLEAIEKLQKQGLLVKKPRLDQDDYSEKSHSDCEDGFDT